MRAWRWALTTRALRPSRLTRGDWAYIVSVYALSRILIVLVGLIGSAMFPSVGPNQTWVMEPITWQTLSHWPNLFDHFDSGWYIGISHGYPALIPGNSEPLRTWGFLPGYPIALHIVAVMLGFPHIPGPVDVIAGVLVSYAALFGAVVYLYRLTAGELDSVAARRAVTYLLVFPTSLFLSAVYPEALLLFATVGAFYHARRRQWLFAGLLAAVAIVTHTEGALALAPLTLEFLAYNWNTGGWIQWRMLKLGWLLGPPLAALGAYALYSHAHTGYWLAFSTSQNLVWGHRLSPPVYPFIGFLLHPGIGSAFDFDFRLLNIVIAVAALALCVSAFRRLPPAYGLSILLGVLLPLSTDGSHTHSLARHIGSLFAFFVAMAAWSLKQRWADSGEVISEPASPLSLELRDRVALLPSLMLLAVFTLMFTAGVWAAI
ncbi:MAG TPA: hypothetical protein VFN78_07200 [Ktedonobacterales bacterium]|nr:hypothetical protein [Ktedonobacterales bacterium]